MDIDYGMPEHREREYAALQRRVESFRDSWAATHPGQQQDALERAVQDAVALLIARAEYHARMRMDFYLGNDVGGASVRVRRD